MADSLPPPEPGPAPVPLPATSDAVTLARMEGTLNLVAFQVSSLGPRVHDLEINSYRHSSQIQAIEQGMEAEARTRVSTALALKEADEARRTKDAETWSPFQRFMAVMVCACGALSVLASFGVFD